MTNPSISGFATAKGLAKFWNIVANGGESQGQRLLSKEVLKKLSEVQAAGIDEVTFFDSTYGRGVTLIPVPTVSLSELNCWVF